MMVDSSMVTSSSGRPDNIDEMHLVSADIGVGRNFEKLDIFLVFSLLSPALLLLIFKQLMLLVVIALSVFVQSSSIAFDGCVVYDGCSVTWHLKNITIILRKFSSGVTHRRSTLNKSLASDSDRCLKYLSHLFLLF